MNSRRLSAGLLLASFGSFASISPLSAEGAGPAPISPQAAALVEKCQLMSSCSTAELETLLREADALRKEACGRDLCSDGNLALMSFEEKMLLATGNRARTELEARTGQKPQTVPAMQAAAPAAAPAGLAPVSEPCRLKGTCTREELALRVAAGEQVAARYGCSIAAGNCPPAVRQSMSADERAVFGIGEVAKADQNLLDLEEGKFDAPPPQVAEGSGSASDDDGWGVAADALTILAGAGASARSTYGSGNAGSSGGSSANTGNAGQQTPVTPGGMACASVKSTDAGWRTGTSGKFQRYDFAVHNACSSPISVTIMYNGTQDPVYLKGGETRAWFCTVGFFGNTDCPGGSVSWSARWSN